MVVMPEFTATQAGEVGFRAVGAGAAYAVALLMVFPDTAMTLAAVDRLVHHATIFEINVDSYRRRAALDRKHKGAGRPQASSRLSRNKQDSALADALQAMCDLDLTEIQAIEPPRGFGRD